MPKILPIVINPNPILRKKSQAVETSDLNFPEFKNLCADMSLTMQKKDGVGLAAPQIGKNIRIIVVNYKDKSKCLINPKIIKKSWRKEWGEEGCLSLPGIFGQVNRHKSIICEYFDQSGKKIVLSARGLMARILQHEIDHLDGILFIDKAKNIKQIENN